MNPPREWIGAHNVRRFVTRKGVRVSNQAWRPFVGSEGQYTVSQAAVQATFAILSSFFRYLMEEGLVDHNPVALIRQKSKFIRKDQYHAPVRRLSNVQLDYFLETAELMGDERTLFIVNCLFAMYLRISEVVADERSTPVMGDFQKDIDGNWWFRVTGKGNKSRNIVVSDVMLASLQRYRRWLGLPALPLPDDETPLIAKGPGAGPMTSSRHIRRIVQRCFDQAYERMRLDGLEDDAAELKAATVHWLRHTGISEDVKHRPREHVRDDAGHSNMATTDRYIDSDSRERHASGRGKSMGRSWGRSPG
jgi:site-specific recombinase XerD